MSQKHQLARLKSLVRKHRKASPGGKPRYGDDVKAICKRVYESGVSVAEIADASDLCIKSIYSWIKTTAKIPRRSKSFQELKIVENTSTNLSATKIVISLPSGARIEVM